MVAESVSPTTRKRRKRVPAGILDEVIRRVVEVARPERIILFGSAAKGRMGPNSDIDLLVIKRGRFDRGRVSEAIYTNLHGVGAAVDVIIVTPDEVERYRHARCLVIAPALAEGKVVYAA
ncbi:MAG: nucleotidyltransferase domain-containing protein [Planctomycetota bacterium]